jgi:hypothetical protein
MRPPFSLAFHHARHKFPNLENKTKGFTLVGQRSVSLKQEGVVFT